MALGFGDKANKAIDNNDSSSAERKDPEIYDPENATGIPLGPGGRPLRRIDESKRRDMAVTSDDSSGSITVGKQIAMEADNAIQYRTCSWPKTAALLFSEYICLAIMSFPWSYSVLGLVPGLILTVVIAALVLYTSFLIGNSVSATLRFVMFVTLAR